MMAAGWGRIINFSSAASLHPPGPLNSAYGTSKVALNQFTRHLAAELAGTGVTANVIHPGEVKTAMWASIKIGICEGRRRGGIPPMGGRASAIRAAMTRKRRSSSFRKLSTASTRRLPASFCGSKAAFSNRSKAGAEP